MKTTQKNFLVAGFALLMAALLWSGCASHRAYPGPIHGLSFDGVVQSIDLTNQSLTLLPLKPGESVVFAWDRSTKFWKNGIPIRPEEIEPGKSVKVHFHLASDTQAHFAASQYIAHHVYVSVPYAPLH